MTSQIEMIQMHSKSSEKSSNFQLDFFKSKVKTFFGLWLIILDTRKPDLGHQIHH